MKLCEHLQKYAETQADKVVFSFLGDNGALEAQYSYSELELESTNLAHHLMTYRKTSLKKGDRVLLVYPPSLDFIVAFLACLKAGIIAVPVFPPDPRQLRKNLFMFTTIQSDCGAKVALTNKKYNWAKRLTAVKQVFSSDKGVWPEMDWIVTDSVKPIATPSSELPEPVDTDIAFLQYTSGSTSEPKGVMITQGNLEHNLNCIVDSLKADDSTTVVSWLPQYHDMGLIGAYLGVLRCGGSGVYMSPISFIKDPPMWIRAMSKYKATHIQGPNFGFKLCARKFRAMKSIPDDLDLSNMKHMFNAAEPIDSEAIDMFNSTFEPFGLERDTISPGYGLAEHTVFVCEGGEQRIMIKKDDLEVKRTVTVCDKGDSGATEIIGCGKIREEIDVIIVDNDSSKKLEENRVGEIWVNSASKAKGYWNKPDTTKYVFQSILPEHQEEENPPMYLRTGDLGFFYKDELFICGRVKDLLIIRGRNHYPQDIEKSIENDTRLRPGCSAAFTIQHRGSERLVVIAEPRSGKRCLMTVDGKVEAIEMIDQIKKSLAQDHGLSPYAICLCERRSVPKTTSGKIARQWCRRAFQQDQLQIIHQRKLPTNDMLEVAYGGQTQNNTNNNKNNNKNANGTNIASKTNEKTPDGTPISKPPTVTKEKEEPRGPISGKALIEALANEIARMTGIPKSTIDPKCSLMEIGMDSMGLTQFRGVIEHQYGLHLEDAEMFGEELSLIRIQQKIDLKNGIQIVELPEPIEQPIRAEENTTRQNHPTSGVSMCCCVPRIRRPQPHQTSQVARGSAAYH